MAKIRIYYCYWFVLEYTIVFVSGKTERLTLCEYFDRGNATVGCMNDETLILKKITYGDSRCPEDSNRDKCHSNIRTYFNNHCLGNDSCTLSTVTLFDNNCKRPPRRLYVTFTCNWLFWYWNYGVYTCANSLSEVKCPKFQYIHITNVWSDSECHDIDTINAIARLDELCKEKRTCLADRNRTSSLYHERFVSFSYGCTGPTESPVTEDTPSTYYGKKICIVKCVIFF
ncbi:uncharacterized protein LOC134727311 [Mytilus trossulus]|uniref:uncharacterized protein LOC134727311 n=1 Tax=Mytilus trossulus TaxID=6551 RepID=UPI003003BB28